MSLEKESPMATHEAAETAAASMPSCQMAGSGLRTPTTALSTIWGEEVGQAIGTEHRVDVAIEVRDQHKAVAAVAEGLQHVAGFIGMVACRVVAVAGNGIGGGCAVGIGRE